MNKTAGLTTFVIFVALFFTGFWYVSTTATGFDMGVETNLTDDTAFTQDENWLSDKNSKSYTAECLEYQNTSIYVDSGTDCTWVSIDYNISENNTGTPESFTYIGDPQEGIIEATITTYDNESNVIGSNTYDLDQGIETIDIEGDYSNVQKVNYVEVEIYLNEQQVNDPLEPRLDEYTLETIDDRETVTRGLTEEDTYIFTMIVFLISGIMVVASFLSEA
jgi:hypothetical protein